MVNDMKTDETLEQFTDRVYFEGGEPKEGLSLLDRVLELDKQGKYDYALDMLYDGIDNIFEVVPDLGFVMGLRKPVYKNVEVVDEMLKEAMGMGFSLTLQLGFLTITCMAKDLLKNRACFYNFMESSAILELGSKRGIALGKGLK
jgi:hypothetical protein